jgi:uncharacterized membrane protein
MKRLIAGAFLLILIFPSFVSAAEPISDIIKGKVGRVLAAKEITVTGTSKKNSVKDIEVVILEGPNKGKKVLVFGDVHGLVTGDKVLLNYSNINGNEFYSIASRNRSAGLLFFVLLFVAVIIAFGGVQGFRSLASLITAFAVVIYVLVPLLVRGYSPVVVSTLIATLILFFAIYLTHGFNRGSTVAFLGTVISVLITGILAFVAVKVCHLSGIISEESLILNVSTSAQLDFSGLLLGGIIIGVLGILDDIAITQVAVVDELYRSARHLSSAEIYKKALRVGREHVSALVNTLVLAYAGASLQLLMLLSDAKYGLGVLANHELFSAEIVRTIVGSIGLVLAVPITTLLAIVVISKYKTLGFDEHAHRHKH